MLMSRKLTLFLGLSLAGFIAASAQSIEPTRSTVKAAASSKEVKNTPLPSRGVIRLNPSNKYNVAPKDVYARLKASSSVQKTNTPVQTSRIAPAENAADSVIIYGIYKPTPGEAVSLDSMGLYSFHAARNFNFTDEVSGKSFPDAYAYTNVDGKYYGFNPGKITILDAATGAVLKDNIKLQVDGADITPMQAATYDPLTKKIYLVYWTKDWAKALCTIDPDTYELTYVCDITDGYPLSVAAAPDNKLYFMIYPSSLYSFDKTTKTFTLVSSNAVAGKSSYQNGDASQTAAFDWSTGQMYLANLTSDWMTHLTKIDPATGTAVNIADFPGKERLRGLYIPRADADAPGFASKINYADGKLNFTVPVKTYSSKADLSGNLTAYLTADGGTPTQVTVTPGQQVSMDYPLTDGKHSVEIAMGNEAGTAPARRLNTFVGTDVPTAVTSLSLSIDDGKTAVLTWAAPTTSVHGGPVDDASLNYQIVRYPDEKVVASGLKELTFTEQIPDAHAHYYYTVTAYTGSEMGASATSNFVTAGSIWYPPYTETFDTEADFDSFKVIDANNDTHTWSYMNPNNDNGLAYLNGNGVYDPTLGENGGTGNKDYLITPSISLKKNIDYRISFHSDNQYMIDEHMTLLLGTKAEVQGNETTLASLNVNSDKDYTFIFSVPSDGLYNLFFLSDAPANSVNMEIDNISIDEYSAFGGPDSVADPAVKAGAQGAFSNTLTFKVPTRTYKGGVLNSISYINIYKNGGKKPAKVFDAPQLGEAVSWTDTDVRQGSVTYRIVPFNEQGQGKEAIVTDWVGLDMPASVTNIKAVMNSDDKAVVTWDKVNATGKHGGYVNPDEVKYVLCRYDENNYQDHWPAVTDSTADAALTDEGYAGPAYGAQQEYVDYLVVAANAAGSSDGTTVGIVLGDPYPCPYTESFADGYVSKDPWTIFGDATIPAWTNETGSGLAVKPYDGDMGMLVFSDNDETSNKQVISGPRVSLADTKAPELSFYMYHGIEAEEGDLTLHVFINYDDEGWVKAGDVEYNNGSDGWSRFSLPLRADAKNVQIAFGAHAADASASIYLDDIKVDESVESDLSIESIGISKKRVEAGESTQVKVEVANYGTKTAQGYKVVLLRGKEEIASQQGQDLSQNTVMPYVFDIKTTKEDAAKSYTYHAAVDYASDVNAANDSSAVVKLYVHGSNLPEAVNLTGATASGTVTLNWNKPATSEIADEVTDNFDSYTSFIIDDIGDWKTYDGDGTETVYFGGPDIPHVYDPKAWQVWAPVEAGFSLDKFDVLTPHSGDKYLACWAASDGVSANTPNDDWLISSDVKPGTDVSFYYRKPNDGSDPQIFEMMYSSTDREPENFKAFDRDSIVSTTDWVHFQYTLPADAKYFAVRSCCKGSYTVAFLDDISYTPLYGSTTAVTLTGYNVYRDNELIASNIAEPTYTDRSAGDAKHTYYVTAVWKEGESNYSNKYESNIGTGIKNTGSQGSAQVKALKGAVSILNAAGMRVHIYTLSGVSLFNRIVDSSAIVSVQPGVYLVNIGKSTIKIAVK